MKTTQHHNTVIKKYLSSTSERKKVRKTKLSDRNRKKNFHRKRRKYRDSFSSSEETKTSETSYSSTEDTTLDLYNSVRATSKTSSIDEAYDEGDSCVNEGCDAAHSTTPTEYEPQIKSNIVELLDIDLVTKQSIFSTQEKKDIISPKVPSYTKDSLLLQKLTHLDIEVSEKLIYECLLNREKSIIEEESDEEILKKQEELKKRLQICNNTEVKQILLDEIFNILTIRLSVCKKRVVNLYLDSLKQLNERSKFTISHNDVLLMLDKPLKLKKRLKKLGLKKINKPTTREDKKPKKTDLKTNKTKVDKVADNNEETPETVDDIKAEDYNKYSNMEFDSEDITLSDDNYNVMIQDFKKFLDDHGTAGVKCFGKLITAHICHTLSKIAEQRIHYITIYLMDKKRKTILQKTSVSDIRINSDIFVLKNVKAPTDSHEQTSVNKQTKTNSRPKTTHADALKSEKSEPLKVNANLQKEKNESLISNSINSISRNEKLKAPSTAGHTNSSRNETVKEPSNTSNTSKGEKIKESSASIHSNSKNENIKESSANNGNNVSNEKIKDALASTIQSILQSEKAKESINNDNQTTSRDEKPKEVATSGVQSNLRNEKVKEVAISGVQSNFRDEKVKEVATSGVQSNLRNEKAKEIATSGVQCNSRNEKAKEAGTSVQNNSRDEKPKEVTTDKKENKENVKDDEQSQNKALDQRSSNPLDIRRNMNKTDRSRTAIINKQKEKENITPNSSQNSSRNEKINEVPTSSNTINDNTTINKSRISSDKKENKENVKDDEQSQNKALDQRSSNPLDIRRNMNKTDRSRTAIINKQKEKENSTELLIYEDSLYEFNTSEISGLIAPTTNQSQNEREALEKSSLFSLFEKQILKTNNYAPVLVDTLLLQKLARLDKRTAKRLIFVVSKQSEVLSLPIDEQPAGDDKENDYVVVIKSKKRMTERRISIKQFLTHQIYNLLHRRLTRSRERSGEILFYLLLQSSGVQQKLSAKEDLKRVRNKIKEYVELRNFMMTKKASKKKNKKNSTDADEGGKKKKKKRKALTKKKVPSVDELNENPEESFIRNNRRAALAQTLYKVHNDLVVMDKERKEKTIKEYVAKQVPKRTTILADLEETSSSSDLS